MTEPTVLVRNAQAVCTITLNRPEVGNTIDTAMTAALEQAVQSAASDAAVRCVVLTGAGKLFCGGGDISAMAAAGDMATYLDGLAKALHRSVVALSSMPKPLVVLVNGPAAGAGLSLAILGDVVVAARSASFSAAYGSIGLTPDGGMSWLLPRLVGLRRAQELILENRRLTASDAAAIGLISRVEDNESLMANGMETARRLAEGPTGAIGMTRALLRDSLGTRLADHLDRETQSIVAAAATPDAAEGVQAFLGRRTPRFGL